MSRRRVSGSSVFFVWEWMSWLMARGVLPVLSRAML